MQNVMKIDLRFMLKYPNNLLELKGIEVLYY